MATESKSHSLTLQVDQERWPLKVPFRITGYTTIELNVLRVVLKQRGYVGYGEAVGVFYRGEHPQSLVDQVEGVRDAIEAGISREVLRQVLPAGGARNAVDCALWDLEAKLSGRPVWQSAGLQRPKPLLTTFTCGAAEPADMAAAACAHTLAKAIKLKLTGEAIDAERVRAVRESRPDVWLGVDANQGLTPISLERLMPTLVDARVSLIEQPFPVGQEALMDGLRSPIPIAADESVQTGDDIPSLIGRFSVINIKLDKCGGLTEALAMAQVARENEMKPMVGNMLGTSLAMAPAFLVGQLCDIVDLDGPIFLKTDRAHAVEYLDGHITCPEVLWGHPAQGAQ